MKSILVALAMLPALASAADFELGLHGASWHAEKRLEGKWNQQNVGLYARAYLSDDTSVELGRYKNSDSLPGQPVWTNYAIAQYTPLEGLGARFGGFAGVGTGYNGYSYLLQGTTVHMVNVQQRTIIVGGGMAVIPVTGQWSVTARLIPKVSANGSWVVGGSIGYRFP